MGDRASLLLNLPKSIAEANMEIVVEFAAPHINPDFLKFTIDDLCEVANVLNADEIDDSTDLQIHLEEMNNACNPSNVEAFANAGIPYLVEHGAGSEYGVGSFGHIYYPVTQSDGTVVNEYRFFESTAFDIYDIKALLKRHTSTADALAELDKFNFYPDDICWEEQANIFNALKASAQPDTADQAAV